MVKVKNMPDFYTLVILLINKSEEIGEKQLSVFDSRGGQVSPLMQIALLLYAAVVIGNLRLSNFFSCLIHMSMKFVIFIDIKVQINGNLLMLRITTMPFELVKHFRMPNFGSLKFMTRANVMLM